MRPHLVVSILAGGLLVTALPALAAVYYQSGGSGTSIDQVFRQLEKQYRLPSGILAKIANVESGGNPHAGSNSSSAYGLFQWTLNSWYSITRAVYGQSLNGGERTNPVTSAKMTAIALKQAQNQNGAQIERAKLDLTLGLYMCHFLGSAGCGRFFQAYLQDPGADASSLFPKEAAANRTVFTGRTLTGVLNFFAARLKVAGASLSLAGNYSDAYGISKAYSNADLSPASFMPKNFVPPAQDPYRTYQTNYASMTQTTKPLTQLTQPVIGTQQAPAPARPYANSAALLIVQPQTVSRGGSLTVAWTSVGMSESSRCRVFQGTVLLAQGNEGWKKVGTNVLPMGELTFRLSCTTASGSDFTQSASVTIQ